MKQKQTKKSKVLLYFLGVFLLATSLNGFSLAQAQDASNSTSQTPEEEWYYSWYEPEPTEAPKATSTPVPNITQTSEEEWYYSWYEPEPTEAPKATSTPVPNITQTPEEEWYYSWYEPEPTDAPKVTSTPTPTATVALLYGDVSDDGAVDSADYTYLRRYLLGMTPELPAKNWKVVGDLNKDGTVDSADFTTLRRYLLRIIKSLPVE